jgi:hypothetical protein
VVEAVATIQGAVTSLIFVDAFTDGTQGSLVTRCISGFRCNEVVAFASLSTISYNNEGVSLIKISTPTSSITYANLLAAIDAAVS